MFLLGLISGAIDVETVIANTLYIPKHSQFSLRVETLEHSIISDAEIAAELEYVVFETGARHRFGSDRAFECYDCPVAVVDNSVKGYKLVSLSPGYWSDLDLLWSVDDKGVYLNDQALLDDNMKDLHQPQIITQHPGYPN